MLTFLIIVVLVVGGLAALVASRPATFRVERSALIKASPEALYPMIADFHAWRAWSPFEDLDPNLRREYSGPAGGVGQVYGWSGNNRAGSGRMEVVQADPSRLVVIKLDFLKPFEAHNVAEFTLEPVGDETRVTWAMYGPNSVMAKAMSLVMSMDKMVGGMFAGGLAKMKAVAEG